jgi:hypothetical protein
MDIGYLCKSKWLRRKNVHGYEIPMDCLCPLHICHNLVESGKPMVEERGRC